MLYVVDYIHLIEKDTRVNDVEGRIVQNAGEDDVLEELESVGVVDFPLNSSISDGDRGMEMSILPEKFPVIRFVIWEFRII